MKLVTPCGYIDRGFESATEDRPSFRRVSTAATEACFGVWTFFAHLLSRPASQCSVVAMNRMSE
jgi:hypothetical protein